MMEKASEAPVEYELDMDSLIEPDFARTAATTSNGDVFINKMKPPMSIAMAPDIASQGTPGTVRKRRSPNKLLTGMTVNPRYKLKPKKEH